MRGKNDKRLIIGTHVIKVFIKGDDREFGEFISISDTGKYMFHFF
jgi:hypothetical protein